MLRSPSWAAVIRIIREPQGYFRNHVSPLIRRIQGGNSAKRDITNETNCTQRDSLMPRGVRSFRKTQRVARAAHVTCTTQREKIKGETVRPWGVRRSTYTNGAAAAAHKEKAKPQARHMSAPKAAAADGGGKQGAGATTTFLLHNGVLLDNARNAHRFAGGTKRPSFRSAVVSGRWRW